MSMLLGGCAVSPQQVAIEPSISMATSEPVSAREIGLTVYDERPSAVMGSRGGVYSETSMISTDENFTRNIRVATEQALEQWGLTVSSGEDIPKFQLYIDRFTYEILDTYFQDVEIKAAAHVEVTYGSQRFTGRYSSDLSQRLVKTPSNKKNDEMLGQVLDDMLTRVFQDERLKEFLGTL